MQHVISRDGTHIAYDTFGAGPVLLIVLGALTTRVSGSVPQLAQLLAQHFTVINFDRRGRGDSTDTLPYTIDKEIDDIQVLIESAGGKAYLYGHSSGAALALDAAVRLGDHVVGLAMYEAPYNNDVSAQQAWREYNQQLTQLLAAHKRGDAVALFRRYTGASAEQIERMRHAPFWPALEAVAPTLAYDHTAILGDLSVPVQKAQMITLPTLVMYGTAGDPSMADAAKMVSQAIPHATLRALENQTHMVDPAVLAPLLVEFFQR